MILEKLSSVSATVGRMPIVNKSIEKMLNKSQL